ncbi:hypothetical protein FOJ82_11040 [Tessaracoccus rhinocerotis]|uniref:SGNH/GDSL hydrolase family protein n=1 Tax=Tessaracoccus rhinocerotis TaxID=1689449 RepID=A0A553JZC5_9ACTN|nr:DUF6270 domain-containing protein [Tessaracoccus rhinocerotis]TRY17799.1 hypothetical protein FOJ82_11040 [Tessaracoccus rhinocerotis]
MAGIFVSGGCVTRDTYEQIKSEHVLTGYSARQSLISANSRPTTLEVDPRGTGFEVRAVMDDLNSTLFGKITEQAGSTDLFVIDLLVERLGVLALPDGSYVTRTPSLHKSGAIGDLFLGAPWIKFNTPEHRRLWTVAANNLVDRLRELGMVSRTLLVETPWASTSLTGTPVKPFLGWPTEEVDRWYEPYYEVLRGLGIRSIRIPEELVLSDDEHKWGASPFHYAPAAHEWLVGQFRSALAASGSR